MNSIYSKLFVSEPIRVVLHMQRFLSTHLSMPSAELRLARITPVAISLRTLLCLAAIHLPNCTILVISRHPALEVSIKLASVGPAMATVAFPGALQRIWAFATRSERDFAVEGLLDTVEVRVREAETSAVNGI